MGASHTARPRRRDGWRSAALISDRRSFVLVRQAEPGAAAGSACLMPMGCRAAGLDQSSDTPAKLLRLNGLSLKPFTFVAIGLYCVECAMGENGSCCAKISCACV
ncbi:hypothetical protein PCO31111_00548 [Pandoraea communis]|uniref:Uncharacterized protein n=1 Tax=Pandoraea communis TaxID=2508297 RepID=A0A5E4S4V7_9BURK|nr:hypothetical protein PCO31111_00548 [Pandoraea communis]